ncbi:MAG: small subunit ribosomal protein S9 [Nitriliruptoraceae bacterium]|jgi:small subunit ribosomal protein S9
MHTKIHVGRRKSAVARASLSRGSGKITVNGKDFESYFPTEKMRNAATEAFTVVDQVGMWDVTARINGGGTTGQSDALKLAISRGLLDNDQQLRPVLKAAGLLTRDSRKVERKKFGLKKARRASQFSKR